MEKIKIKKIIRWDGPDFPVYKEMVIDATITPVQGWRSNEEKAIHQAYRIESKQVRMIAYLRNGVYCQSTSTNDHF